MSRRGCIRAGALGSLVAIMAAALPLSAQAITLGTVAPASASGTCIMGEFFVDTTSVAPSYTVPEGGGAIESWSYATAGAAAGMPISLVVLHQTAPTSFEVITSDTEILPTPLPASGVATFNLTVPILVKGGDLLGLESSLATGICYYSNSVPADSISIGKAMSTAPGTSYLQEGSAPGYGVNLSAVLDQDEDAGLSETVGPASITAGGVGIFRMHVSNGGPVQGPITLVDTVPAGVNLIAAAANSGNCTVSSQVVTCTITEKTGETSEVDIAVSAPTAGSFTNGGAVVATGDPNPGNNSASATLTVNAPPAPPAPACKVIALAGAQLSLAKLVIPALNCTLGKTTSEHSKKIRKGLVIKTTPGAGATLAAGTTVNVVISSGPPKKKAKKKAKKH